MTLGNPLFDSVYAGPALVVAVQDQDALAAARPHVEVFESHLPRDQITGIHLYTRAILQEVDIQTRMFAPLHGVSEDPATGSANVALIGLLAHLQDDRTAAMDIRIGQGHQMGRPSLLDASAEMNDDGTIATYIGGRCVSVMRGVIDVA